MSTSPRRTAAPRHQARDAVRSISSGRLLGALHAGGRPQDVSNREVRERCPPSVRSSVADLPDLGTIFALSYAKAISGHKRLGGGSRRVR